MRPEPRPNAPEPRLSTAPGRRGLRCAPTPRPELRPQMRAESVRSRAPSIRSPVSPPSFHACSRRRRRRRCAAARTRNPARRRRRARSPSAPARRTAGERHRGVRRRPEPRRDGATPGSGLAPAEAGRAARRRSAAAAIHDAGGSARTDDDGSPPTTTPLRMTTRRPPRRSRAPRPRRQAAEIRLRQPRTGDGELARPPKQQSLKTAKIGRCVRLATVAAGIGTTLAAAVSPAVAQDISINFGQGGGLTERVIQLIALHHGAVAGAVDPDHDDLVHAHRRGAVAAAHRARHRDRAAQCGDRRARPVPHRLRDGAGASSAPTTTASSR